MPLKAESDPDAEVNPRLKHYVHNLRAMVNIFDGWVDYDFSESLELFNEARLEMRLDDLGSRFTCPAPDGSHRFLSEPECINVLVERIREISQSHRYVRAERDRADETKVRTQELERYVYEMMESHPRTMVVRLSLYYTGVLKSWLRVGDVFADRCRLDGLIGHHRAFTQLSGHVLKIEQTDRRGFCIHATFFFDASVVKNEECRALLIGELWTEITQGKGRWDDIDQALSGWRGRGIPCTTGVFRGTDLEPILRVAKAITSPDQARKDLRIMPEGGQVFMTGRRPDDQVYQTAYGLEVWF